LHRRPWHPCPSGIKVEIWDTKILRIDEIRNNFEGEKMNERELYLKAPPKHFFLKVTSFAQKIDLKGIKKIKIIDVKNTHIFTKQFHFIGYAMKWNWPIYHTNQGVQRETILNFPDNSL